MTRYSLTFPFMVQNLPYSLDSLEPYIDEKSLYYHKVIFDTYIERLNNAISPYPEYYKWTLEQLLTYIHKLPPKLKDGISKYGGGVYNHILYFQGMGINKKNKPETTLLSALEDCFGSYDDFKNLFQKNAMARFASGYTYLVQPFPTRKNIFSHTKKCSKLAIVSAPNQISPLSFGLYPLLAIDLWEHAYYLKHKNLRNNYIEDWFHVINWNAISDYYSSDLNLLPFPQMK